MNSTQSVKDVADRAQGGLRPAPSLEGVYVLGHLSDPHLSTLEGVRPGELVNKRVLGYLSWLRRRRFEHLPGVLASAVQDLRSMDPDHIVITGDLTHIGLPGEFAQVRAWLERLGPPRDVTVIPGNHDAYVRASARQTLTHWLPYLASDGMQGDGPPDALFPSLRLRGPLALIGLSSAVPTAPFLASGAVGQVQMARLEGILRRTAEQGYIRVVMIHHPPVPDVVGVRKHLRDAPALRSLLERLGAELILHGHAHAFSLKTLNTARGRVPVIGAPSASARGGSLHPAGGYHLYRFSRVGRRVEMEVACRGYAPATGRFTAAATRTLELPLSLRS